MVVHQGMGRGNKLFLNRVSPGCSSEGLMLKLKLPILWPPDAKSWLIWKDPDAGKDWGQEEKGTTEGEMVGWHHWLHGFGWTPGVGDGQGGLGCCGSWGHKELDTTERLNWTELNLYFRSVQFSCSVVSNSLWSHELQHIRLPCPSPTPRSFLNSCPSNQWCNPTISSSVISFSSHLQPFPASGFFPMSLFFSSGDQSIGTSA